MMKRAKPAPLPDTKDSLLFFVYPPGSKCSEARMTQVKNGLTLAEVVKTQEQAFNSQIVHTRQNSITYRDPLPKLSAKLSLSHGVESTKEYYPVCLGGTSQPLSPAMQEYLMTGDFDKDIERKKHKQLKRYFFVRHSALSNPPLPRLARLSISDPKCRPHATVKHFKLPAFEFEDGITRVNEEVECIVNQTFERKKQEEDQRKKLTMAQKRFADRLILEGKKTTMSPGGEIDSMERGNYEGMKDIRTEPIRVETEGKIQMKVRMQRSHSKEPIAMIKENQKISKALSQHFLKNVQQRRKMPQKSPTLASFFITNS